jgi:hypothetical protein
MRYLTIRYSALAAIALVLAISGPLAADSAIVTPGDGYGATDLLPTEWIGDVCLFGDSLAQFTNEGGLEIIPRDNPAARQSWGKPDDYLAMYSSGSTTAVWSTFVTPDPSGNSLWVGFTITTNADDRIYQVDSSGVWTHRATLTGNYDLEFFGGDAYVSGNPGATALPFTPANTIYLLDTSGANNHDVLAEIGGYSAGFGIDDSGDLYFGTYYLDDDGDGLGPGDCAMHRYTAAQLEAAIGQQSLSLSDAEELFPLPFGPGDVEMDDAGNLVFDANPEEVTPFVAAWKTVGGAPPVEVASAANSGSAWLCLADVEGNVLGGGGTVYAVDYNQPGIAEIFRLAPGDANGDGRVDADDAAILADNWGDRGNESWAKGDFNGDGSVGLPDAAILAANWGYGVTPGEATATPEPNCLALVASLLTVVATRRRRRNQTV